MKEGAIDIGEWERRLGEKYRKANPKLDDNDIKELAEEHALKNNVKVI